MTWWARDFWAKSHCSSKVALFRQSRLKDSCLRTGGLAQTLQPFPPPSPIHGSPPAPPSTTSTAVICPRHLSPRSLQQPHTWTWLPSLLPPAIFHAATRVVWLKCISDRSGSSSTQNIPWLPISSRGKLPTPCGIPGPGRSLMLRSPSALEPALCSKRSHRSEKPGSPHPTITTYHSLPGWLCSSLTLLLCASNHPDIRCYHRAFALAVPTPSSYDSFIPQVSASVATSQWELSDP